MATYRGAVAAIAAVAAVDDLDDWDVEVTDAICCWERVHFSPTGRHARFDCTTGTGTVVLDWQSGGGLSASERPEAPTWHSPATDPRRSRLGAESVPSRRCPTVAP